MMRLLQLRYFRDVGKMLSISEAAKQHMIPQPAMSKAIIELERELGVSLFDRINKRLHLTPEGMLFWEEVDQTLFHLDKGVSLLQSNNNIELAGELNLLITQSHRLIINCVTQFMNMYPLVKINVSTTHNHVVPQNNQIDFCIGNADAALKFNQHLILFHDQVMLLVPTTHKLAGCKKIHLHEVSNETFLVCDPSSLLWETASIQCRKIGFEPQVGLYCDDNFCFESFFRTGNFLSFITKLEAAFFPEQDIVAIQLEPTFFIHTDLMWDNRHTLGQPALAFQSKLEVYCSDLVRAYL